MFLYIYINVLFGQKNKKSNESEKIPFAISFSHTCK